MIVVKVELHSAVTRRVSEIARMHIINDGGGTRARGNYEVMTCRGRSAASLSQGVPQRKGFVRNYPRLAIHVWNLVAAALSSMDYGMDLKAKRGGE